MDCQQQYGQSPPIPWPGHQMTNLNDFNQCCFHRCFLENPSDPYESPCGLRCQRLLRQQIFLNGFNTCEKRLQPSVSWYTTPNDAYRKIGDLD